MRLTMMSDILFREDIGSDQLRSAAASAFRIDEERVAVAEAAGTDPIPSDAQVVLLHEPEDMPGDFPIWYGLSVDPDLVPRVDDAMDSVARTLGMVLVTDAEDYFEMTLHLPDGTRHTVELFQDDDNAFRITPEIQRLIDSARLIAEITR